MGFSNSHPHRHRDEKGGLRDGLAEMRKGTPQGLKRIGTWLELVRGDDVAWLGGDCFLSCLGFEFHGFLDFKLLLLFEVAEAEGEDVFDRDAGLFVDLLEEGACALRSVDGDLFELWHGLGLVQCALLGSRGGERSRMGAL